MTDAERRFTSVLVEARASSDGKVMTIGGYAAKFDRLSQNLGGFVERIEPGFFNKSRGDGWPGVVARYNHDDNQLLGTTRAGTLRLSIDDVGLDYGVDLPQARADVFELVQRGDVAQSSFAMVVFEDDWSMTDQNFPLRSLISGSLRDVAPVNSSAYLDTSVGTRNLDVAFESLARKFEADVTEVRNLAEANELVRFFKRTDGGTGPEPKRSAQAALAKALQLN
jgi:HK97 family phage prohead protease